MKKIISIIAVVLLLASMMAIPVSAKSYQTYTYSYDGFALDSPDAYLPITNGVKNSNTIGLENLGGTALKNPTDLEVDEDGYVYIADSDNDRIVILDNYYNFVTTISTFQNENLIDDKLDNPQGVFVTPEKIYVCDTDNARIVTFDRDLDGDGEYSFNAIIPQPESTLFDEGAIYRPIAMAVDEFNRLFVVSSTTYQGIIVMTDTGDFTGFIGAQKSNLSAWDIIWRRFQTDEQRAQSERVVATEFNNITITDDGFIYVTTSSIDESAQQGAITGKSKAGDYAPVKMLNAAGEEIMRRNGFWPPSGEVNVKRSISGASVGASGGTQITGASMIVDVAVGPEKTWSIIDQKRSKVFTYDFDGNLLFVFGDSGNQLGNVSNMAGVVYQGDRMLVLDKNDRSFTVFERTEYGNTLIEALRNQNNRQYNLAVDDWTEILKRNSNFDAAYIGIGQSLYRSGEYEEAMSYYEAAYDTANWSDSYKEIRKEWISKFIILIPVAVVAICLLCSMFLKYCKKVNTKAAVAGGKRNFKEEVLYAFHVIFHPFDGFWDLKHEKRGSLRAAIFFIAITVISFFYQAVGTGYVSNPQGSYSTIVDQAISVLIPLVLFAIANWCLTTLFDGEGSFKDVVIAIGYAIVPMIIVLIPTTIISNFLLVEELDILSIVVTFGYLWSGLLIFLGMMVTHDYSMGKNFLTTVGTLVGMVFIMFVALLFTTLLGKIVGFISNIVTELNYRM